MLPRAILALSLATVTVLPAAAQSAPASTLLVLSKRAHTLAIVDPTTLKVLATVPVGNDPHEVIASADGSTAYVSNYGFGAFNTLAVVDLLHQSALPAIDLGPLHGPHGLTFVDGKVWFTAEAAKAIGHYDPATHKVDWILGTGQNRTHMIYVAPDVRRIVTTNVNSATVSLIELGPTPHPGPPPGALGQGGPGGGPPPKGGPGGPGGPQGGPPREDWNETVIPVGHGSEGFDVSPSGKEIWVANAQDGTLSVIDVASKRVVATLPANVPGANRLKFTPDGRHVLIAAQGDHALTVYDAASRHEIKHLAIARGAAGIVMEPNGKRAFVACSPDNFVAVIDLSTLTVIGRIDAGGEPDGMAWATHP